MNLAQRIKKAPPVPTGEGASSLPTEQVKKLSAFFELMGIDPSHLLPKHNPKLVTAAEWAEYLVAAHLKELTRRFPLPADKKKNRPAEVCPFTGLNRTQIHEASTPRKDGRPYIRTISLAEEGEEKGARFYHVQDAIDYMQYLSRQQNTRLDG